MSAQIIFSHYSSFINKW